MSKTLTKENLEELMTTLIKQEPDDMWDYPPVFFLVVGIPNEDRWGLVLDSGTAEGFVRWGGNPMDYIETMTRAFDTPFSPDYPHGLDEGHKLLGVILRNEGWGLSSDDIPTAELLEWQQSGRRFNEHPKAVETKTYAAYATGIGATAVMMKRDQEPETAPSHMEGRIADGLREWVEAFGRRFPDHA